MEVKIGGENCSTVILAAVLTNVDESSYLLKEGLSTPKEQTFIFTPQF